MHFVNVDHARRRVFVRCVGYLDVAASQKLRQDLELAIRALDPRVAPLSILSDLSNVALQGQQQTAIFEKPSEEKASVANAHHAIVTQSALVRIQLKRILADMEVSYFEKLSDAFAWLRWEPTYRAYSEAIQGSQQSL